MVINTPAFRNELLSALPPDELDQFRPSLHPVTFVLRQVLHEVGGPMDDVFFGPEGPTA